MMKHIRPSKADKEPVFVRLDLTEDESYWVALVLRRGVESLLHSLTAFDQGMQETVNHAVCIGNDVADHLDEVRKQHEKEFWSR